MFFKCEVNRASFADVRNKAGVPRLSSPTAQEIKDAIPMVGADHLTFEVR
jgi:hypothetical protein